MLVTMKKTEDEPLTYPTVTGLTDEADALDKGALWGRIEAHVSWRWSSRDVSWIAVGEGDWSPLLAPATLDDAYVWDDASSAWTATTDYTVTPLGLCVPCGTYRFDCTVGASVDLPDTVAEAFRRYAEYLAEEDPIGLSGVSRYELDVGDVSESISRRADYLARSLYDSGAADLLRPYRRL